MPVFKHTPKINESAFCRSVDFHACWGSTPIPDEHKMCSETQNSSAATHRSGAYVTMDNCSSFLTESINTGIVMWVCENASASISWNNIGDTSWLWLGSSVCIGECSDGKDDCIFFCCFGRWRTTTRASSVWSCETLRFPFIVFYGKILSPIIGFSISKPGHAGSVYLFLLGGLLTPEKHLPFYFLWLKRP